MQWPFVLFENIILRALRGCACGIFGMEPENNEKTPWTEQETFALIRLWEDHLGDLRRTKRNAKVYGEIVEKLRAMGYSGSVKEVKKKMENLGNKYRLVLFVFYKIASFTRSRITCMTPALLHQNSDH
uniref:Putative transcription factor gt-2 n=1 Tax=Ixodes ricinus TaxID=34613 RepID=A0A147BBQ9_IXORI